MKRLATLAILMLLMAATTASAASLLPSNSGRAAVALPGQSQKGVFISWRLLPTDGHQTTFDVVRDGIVIAKGLKNATSLQDNGGSPLFNESGDTERWHTAATYYKQLLAACDERGKGLTTKYADLWSTNNYTTAAITKEIIFGRRYYTSNAGDHLVESYNYPVGIENGKGGNCPTQNLVDAYNMADGTPITDPASGYDEQNPYQNRDPRLAATIAVNGDVWPTYQTKALQTYFGGTNGEPLTGATPTGYYLKKLCHGEISLASNATTANNYHTYVIFRMGGFWLDYAEALFRYLGSADATTTEFPVSAREAASKTRVRAGIPELPTGLSNTDFWTRYKQERMVELCFEGYRFWDVRRWKEAPQYFTSITEMKITRADDGTLTYTRQQQSRQWDDKMYFYPIPQTERMKNPNLTQNSGW